ncbi:hypothetical protein ZHAS_00005201 [Anopheles sinensis]|uniref:Secreted protein n=1 Tax=Anopheles sinensis TaxID=74873 RepID=A0A084VIT9_ANOSI|nr:hypothetical protein ZHAS_00005201 [Anopheles sinensis]
MASSLVGWLVGRLAAAELPYGGAATRVSEAYEAWNLEACRAKHGLRPVVSHGCSRETSDSVPPLLKRTQGWEREF